MEAKMNYKRVLKTAGAFMGWMIGSGFATGQEVLQFFSSYGYQSFAVVALNLLGFIGLGYLLIRNGFLHKDAPQFNHFRHYCGNKFGALYTWLTTITILFLMPVLVAGAGATLNQYYDIHPHLGSALMAGLVLLVYLVGFERMIGIISSLGPVIIAFSLSVGVITCFRDLGNWGEIPSYDMVLRSHQATPHWFLSGLLYLGLNLFPGSSYLTQLGSTGHGTRELKYGVVLGGSLLLLSLGVMSTAILLNGQVTANLDIPVLYLARQISHGLGAVFSIVLVLGMFSTCTMMMWTACSRFNFVHKSANTAFAVAVAIFTYLASLFSFSKLISTVYPLIGYVGLTFLARVFYKEVLVKGKKG